MNDIFDFGPGMTSWKLVAQPRPPLQDIRRSQSVPRASTTLCRIKCCHAVSPEARDHFMSLHEFPAEISRRHRE